MFRGADVIPLPTQTKLVLHTQSIGSTGTESYSGYNYEDYLQEMHGKERAKLFDKIRRSDPQIKMCLNAVKSPIKAALWEVQPFDSEDEESKADAELVEFVLMQGMDKSFKQFLSESLTCLDFGHSVFEIIDKAILGHPKFGNVNGLRSLAFRSPRTIERWNLDSNTDNLVSITQYAYGDLEKLVDIPAEFLLIFSLDREGSNYEGISAIRCCYGNWFRKDQYLKLNAIGIESFAIPTPLVKVPNGKESGEQYDHMRSALEAYVTHEKNYLTYPEGWEIELNTNPYDPQKVEVSIDNEDKRIVKAFMANFLELGMNGFGSQSLSFDLSDFFLGAIEHVAHIVAEGINQTIIPRIIQMNRGQRPGYPKLCVSGISDRAGKELSEVLKNYADSKIITPDDVLEAHIRRRYNLPEASDLGKRQVTPTSVPQFSEKIKRLIR